MLFSLMPWSHCLTAEPRVVTCDARQDAGQGSDFRLAHTAVGKYRPAPPCPCVTRSSSSSSYQRCHRCSRAHPRRSKSCCWDVSAGNGACGEAGPGELPRSGRGSQGPVPASSDSLALGPLGERKGQRTRLKNQCCGLGKCGMDTLMLLCSSQVAHVFAGCCCCCS